MKIRYEMSEEEYNKYEDIQRKWEEEEIPVGRFAWFMLGFLIGLICMGAIGVFFFT